MLVSRNLSLGVGIVVAVSVLFGATVQAALPVSGASYHFDATAIDPGDLTEVRIDGSDVYVHTWEDQTANNNDAANGTTTLQPLYIPDGSKYGDRPVVRFDGGDRLIASHAFADLDAASGATLFVVARQPGVTGSGISHALDGGAAGTDRRFSTQAEPAGGDVRFNYRANIRDRQLRYNVSQAIGLNWNERTLRFDGAAGGGNLDKVKFYHNNSNTPEGGVAESGSGTLSTTVGAVANVILGALQSDGTASWVGEIAEIVMFPTALGSTDLAAMHSYLENKWFRAIPTLPVSGASYHFDAGTVSATDVGQVRIDGPNAYVHTFLDRSTNGNDAVNTTDARQPLYVADGSEFGNLSVLDFDGSDDRLIASHAFADLDAAAGCTLFVVARQTTVNGGTSHAVDNGPDISDRRFCTQGDPATGDVRFNYRASITGREYRHIVPGAEGSTWNQRTLRFDGASGPSNLDKVDVYYNYNNTPVAGLAESGSGVLGSAVGAVANVIIGALEDDGLAPWDGEIAEIVMFPSALNSSDLAKMHAYLLNRWKPPMGTLVLIK